MSVTHLHMRYAAVVVQTLKAALMQRQMHPNPAGLNPEQEIAAQWNKWLQSGNDGRRGRRLSAFRCVEFAVSAAAVW